MKTRVFDTGIVKDDWVEIPEGYKRVYKGRVQSGDLILSKSAL